ncbi:uncharacterized protein F5Z01DRAFT_646478 [Emericellopsis atlantica]|uniref:Uncharacterized protein n=1 Tax=Emericellopsis atlantica TaxID=2614577 RepID=A0A9P8CSQ3_9HYPO|nr:uncharacterized protein F5Z01DRAFT_646478 [Emericellopsis atlantica]KAG9257607.1 hypothetical protein F5Z01DRAFT_646478 [Emericellopsis atlantica]
MRCTNNSWSRRVSAARTTFLFQHGRRAPMQGPWRTQRCSVAFGNKLLIKVIDHKTGPLLLACMTVLAPGLLRVLDMGTGGEALQRSVVCVEEVSRRAGGLPEAILCPVDSRRSSRHWRSVVEGRVAVCAGAGRRRCLGRSRCAVAREPALALRRHLVVL